MSGFEVVGVVLGAFPIAIEGLKSYKKQKTFWENWREIRREYEACLNNLEIQQTFFKDHLHYLLLLLVAEPDRIDVLIAQPGSQEWASPHLDKALRRRLDRSYNIYMKSICSMRALIENAKEYLGKESLQARLVSMEDTTGVHPWRSTAQKQNLKKEIMYQQARLRFTMGQSAREEYFVKLQTLNKTLQELLESRNTILSLRRHMLIDRIAGSCLDVDICEFWQYAQDLYTAFSEAWTCPCRYQHQTQVMLQHRRNNDKEMRLILREPSSYDNGTPFGHGVAIREAVVRESSQQEQPSQASEQYQTSPSSSRSSRTKQAATETSARSVIQLQALHKGKEIDNAALDSQLVTNLCSKVMTGFNSDHRADYLQSNGRKYYIFSRICSGDRLGLQQTSLEKILRGSEFNMTDQQRYVISLNLVSSFIQLRETPWITSSWQKSSILFPEQSGYPNMSDLNEPFLTHTLQAAAAVDLDSDLPPRDFGSLGVTLLELCLARVIEDQPERLKYPPTQDARTKAALDAHVAGSLLKEVTTTARPEYRNAIDWCLSKHKTFCGPGWRQEMFQQVVCPLYEMTQTCPP